MYEYIYMNVHMRVSPYLCLSKNTYISLQKYLHLSPVKLKSTAESNSEIVI